jgi:hypothetical protein
MATSDTTQMVRIPIKPAPCRTRHNADVVSVRVGRGGCFGLAWLRFGQDHRAARRAAGG